MKIFLLAFLLFSTIARAENVPLPSSVLGVDEIIEEFRGTLKSKIVDLGKNYISQTSDHIIVFKNSADINCNGNKIAKGNPITSLRYNSTYNDDGKELNEKALYVGCSGEYAFVEDVITRGTNLKPITFNDFIRGKRTFDLKDNENSRLYRVSNNENEEIFKVIIEKLGNGKIADFYYLGQKFLSINYNYSTSSTRAIFTAYSYNATYVRKYGKWSSRSNYSPVSFSVFVNQMSKDQVQYYDGSLNLLSLNNFLGLMNDYLLNSTLSSLRSIFEYHTYYFPSTETTSSGAASQKLLEELRIAQSRLLTNTELNLVRNFIQELINATEAGQISDNRPSTE